MSSPTKIDWHFARRFGLIFGSTFLVALFFYELIILADFAPYLIRYEASLSASAAFMILLIPRSIEHTAPIATTLAIFLTITLAARAHELTVCQLAGASRARISAPFIAWIVLIGALSALNSEFLAARSTAMANKIYYEKIKGQPERATFSKYRFWLKGKDGSFVNFGAINDDRTKLSNLTIYRFDPGSSRVKERISAESAVARSDRWEARGYVSRSFDSDADRTEKIKRARSWLVPTQIISPADLGQVEARPDEMNFKEISTYIDELESSGYQSHLYRVERHIKIALPLVNLVLGLLAIALGFARVEKIGRVEAISASASVAVGILVCALFWFAFSTGIALGKHGAIAPSVGVYGAHFIALGAVAGVAFRSTRRRARSRGKN